MTEKTPPLTLLRLSLVNLFIFTPISCWWLTLATYIDAHTGDGGFFKPGFVGVAYCTGAIGTMAGPLLWGIIADRWIAAEKLVVGLQLVCAGLVWSLSNATSQNRLWWTMLAYALCFSPMNSLTAAICFRHLKDPKRTFPAIRILSTLSWIFGGWLIGYVAPWWFGHSIEASNLPMRIAAGAHIFTAVVCLTSPATPPLPTVGKPGVALPGLSAFRTLFSSDLCIPAIALTLLAIPAQFYNNFSNVFLNDQGIAGAVGHLSWGQVTEMGVLLLVPLALLRWGMRWTLFVGAAAWPLRFVLFAMSSNPAWQLLYWPAILLHGVGFGFCYFALQMLADERTEPEARASVQGLITVLSMGVGAFIGSQIGSRCEVAFSSSTGDGLYDWWRLWMTAAAMAIVPTLLLLFARREQSHD